LLEVLPGREEAAAALLSVEPDVRAAWLSVTAARMKELGQRRDVSGLCQAIDTLGEAAPALLAILPHATLAPTGLEALEREVLGASADLAVAALRLFRALGATASLVEGGRGQVAPSLPDIAALDPSINWIPGRLLRLPSSEEQAFRGATSVLSGGWRPLEPHELSDIDSEAQLAMRWVLARPWPFLLAQLVYLQEAWTAERVEGGLTLELDEAELSRFHQPARVRVVVTTRAGVEVVCGTLEELLTRALGLLGVSLLSARLAPGALDALLAPVIEALLYQRVWRFEHGHGGRAAGYFIHPAFSDACYRTLGSRYFYRLGSGVTGVLRHVCERWAEERLARAGGPAAVGEGSA